MRLFSYKNRPIHLGPYPLERLLCTPVASELAGVPKMASIPFSAPGNRASLINAMSRYAALLDAIRDGLVKKERGEVPDDLRERSNHLKAFGYYHDASQIAVCALTPEMFLPRPIENPDIGSLATELKTRQTSTLAAGIDVVMAELKDAMEAPPTTVDHHTHALVFLYEYPRDPAGGEAGCDWVHGMQAQRASVRAAETTVVLSNYIRLLGFEARGHSGSCADVDLNRLAVAAGLGEVVETSTGPAVVNPFVGTAFGLGAITTTFRLQPDLALAPGRNRTLRGRLRSRGPAWWLGKGHARNALNARPYRTRRFRDGPYPFERIKRRNSPTTFIDEPRVARVPKRTDMFARAIFGDMGKHVQDATRNGNYVRKSAASFGPRRPLAAFVLLQDGAVNADIAASALDPQTNSDNVKGAAYFLGADAVGISRCPDWAYYSHDALGNEIDPYHANAISMVIDQGHETMEGASGDDWIACSQSMRAYLRFSLLGGIIAEHIRNLGYSARSHTVMDGEVLQPPLLLLSGLGEVSRIGEVVLNPYLGPRLKSGVITTDMPLAHDKPIDFGLQNFCNACNKCARECPSGAITAGPKTMFNGYEIWKSDSQKCTQYRVTQTAGAMCGRCMKTCPWNLEGLFAEAPFRWAASRLPGIAGRLAKLDDKLGRGGMNPVKKWWWDLEMIDDGPYRLSPHASNKRDLQTDLDLRFEDQTLAVYPANLAPPPYPFPFPMDREAGIRAYRELLSPADYKARLASGDTDGLAHEYSVPDGPSPVIRVNVAGVERLSEDITTYDLTSIDGSPLPAFEAGAHLDVVVAPEFFRQYSLCGDPADRRKYRIGVLREPDGRGGSQLLHKIFSAGRKIFVSRPINHFPLVENASRTILLGAGIGITPMISMAYRLHALGREFDLHYSCTNRQRAAFLGELERVAWRRNVHVHLSSEGSRADLDEILRTYRSGYHAYACGPEAFIAAVSDTCERHAWPASAVHKEYFSAPESPEYVNESFTIVLQKSGERVRVAADQSAADALIQAGRHVDMKCSDGICGVCKCTLVAGDVEHRDFVLSAEQRQHNMILCQSRASERNGEIVIDLA